MAFHSGVLAIVCATFNGLPIPHLISSFRFPFFFSGHVETARSVAFIEHLSSLGDRCKDCLCLIFQTVGHTRTKGSFYGLTLCILAQFLAHVRHFQ